MKFSLVVLFVFIVGVCLGADRIVEFDIHKITFVDNSNNYNLLFGSITVQTDPNAYFFSFRTWTLRAIGYTTTRQGNFFDQANSSLSITRNDMGGAQLAFYNKIGVSREDYAGNVYPDPKGILVVKKLDNNLNPGFTMSWVMNDPKVNRVNWAFTSGFFVQEVLTFFPVPSNIGNAMHVSAPDPICVVSIYRMMLFAFYNFKCTKGCVKVNQIGTSEFLWGFGKRDLGEPTLITYNVTFLTDTGLVFNVSHLGTVPLSDYNWTTNFIFTNQSAQFRPNLPPFVFAQPVVINGVRTLRPVITLAHQGGLYFRVTLNYYSNATSLVPDIIAFSDYYGSTLPFSRTRVNSESCTDNEECEAETCKFSVCGPFGTAAGGPPAQLPVYSPSPAPTQAPSNPNLWSNIAGFWELINITTIVNYYDNEKKPWGVNMHGSMSILPNTTGSLSGRIMSVISGDMTGTSLGYAGTYTANEYGRIFFKVSSSTNRTTLQETDVENIYELYSTNQIIRLYNYDYEAYWTRVGSA